MLDILTGFVSELRQAGLPVSVAEEADAAEALGHLRLEDRQAIKFALGATLVKSANHWRGVRHRVRDLLLDARAAVFCR